MTAARRAALALVLAAALGTFAPAARAEPVLTLGPTDSRPVPTAVTDAAGPLHAVWRDVRLGGSGLLTVRIGRTFVMC